MFSQYRLLLVVTSIAAALDQTSKAIAAIALSNGRTVSLLGEVFELRYRHNPGVAWGLGAALDTDIKRFLFPILFLVIGVALVALYRRTKVDEHFRRVGISLILGGGVGNVVDRLRLGQVVDFIGVDFSGSNWTMSGTFNFADVWMVVGALMVVSAGFVIGRRKVTEND